MTPFELDILLHYYACADDHGVVNTTSPPIWDQTRESLFSDGLLTDRMWAGQSSHSKYVLTSKGRAYIDHLLQIPLPVLVTSWQFSEP